MTAWDTERRFQRAPCSFPGTYACGGKTSPVRVTTLSIGGGFFACRTRPPSGSDFAFAIRLSDQYLIRGRGMVIWNSSRKKSIPGIKEKLPPGFGVEFTELREEDREVIDSFVRRKLHILRHIAHELKQDPRDSVKIKSLFSEIHPDHSQHINHIRKVVTEELRYFRLRR